MLALEFASNGSRSVLAGGGGIGEGGSAANKRCGD
jgi:hypothetical protein